MAPLDHYLIALLSSVLLFFHLKISFLNYEFLKFQNLDLRHAASINMKNIGAFADTFLADLREQMQWLTECSNHGGLSKSLFLLIILQAVIIHNEGSLIINYILLVLLELVLCYMS